MKIAVTYEQGRVFEHFGHTEQFKMYEVEDGKIKASGVIGTQGSGHGELAVFLKRNGVDTLICGGIGAGAKQALEKEGIRLFGGVTGDTDKAVMALLANSLVYNPDIECEHHHEEHQHG